LADIVAPEVAVVTNIQLEHTATFGTLQDIAEGEAEILEALPQNGTAVLPRDDAFFDFLKSKAGKKAVKSFGFSPEADVSAKNISVWPGPTRFTLVHRGAGKSPEEADCTLPVLGRFNVLNACAAAAASLSLGGTLETVRKGLESFAPPQMRFQ